MMMMGEAAAAATAAVEHGPLLYIATSRRRRDTISLSSSSSPPTAFSSSSSSSYSSAFPFPHPLKLRSTPPLSAIVFSSSTSASSTPPPPQHQQLSTSPPNHLPSPPPMMKKRSSVVGIIGKSQKWWEKGLQPPNMKQVTSAQDLVDSLLSAGDKLVVLDFFSPGCAGCKALHPKICQLAEMNPDVIFLEVNYEEHKSMCYALNVHVLPFFRFYRGALGRLCSFSCTNATIKKFKDALAKYGADFCSLGPTKGLEEKELLALAANRDLSFNYNHPQLPAVASEQEEESVTEIAAATPDAARPLPLRLPLPLPSQQKMEQHHQSNF